MATIPNLETLLNETEKVSNSVLEKAYKEISLFGGIKRYGRVKELPEIVEVNGEKIPFKSEVIKYLRETINYRNINGKYYFNSRSEQKRFKKINLNPESYLYPVIR